MTSRKQAGLTGELAGMRIMIPRAPERAAGMVNAVASRGAEPLLVPLIDFELPADTTELDASLVLLSEGRFAWLVITSITTIRALKDRATAMGRQLSLMIPASTRVAAVGQSTREVLIAEGIPVHFVPPGEQSGRSLVEDWPVPDQTPAGSGISNRVFVPQSNIASGTVAQGLTERGWQVLPVDAYRTVDYPGDPLARITAQITVQAISTGRSGTASQAVPLPPVTSVDEFRQQLDDGRVDAIVLTSPSTARRVARIVGKLPAGTLTAAIGEITASEARLLGLPVNAVATEPNPAGIAGALASAVRRKPTVQRRP